MILEVDGLTGERAVERVKAAYLVVCAGIGSWWWTWYLAPRQIGPAFQALIRPKYAYSLPLIYTPQQVRDSDE